MIGELAARRRGNQVHVIPVSPGVDCGSRALTPLLSTRFGGRKLITNALSFGVTCRLQADRCHTIGQGIKWYAATAAAWQRSHSLDEVLCRASGFHPARGECRKGSRALRSLSRARSMQRTTQSLVTGGRARTGNPHDRQTSLTNLPALRPKSAKGDYATNAGLISSGRKKNDEDCAPRSREGTEKTTKSWPRKSRKHTKKDVATEHSEGTETKTWS